MPPPYGPLLLVGAEQRWRPLTSGVPIGYRAERSAALRGAWASQAGELRGRLEEVASRLAKDARQLEVRLF